MLHNDPQHCWLALFMASLHEEFAKGKREPSTPTSRKRSKRHCQIDFLQGSNESALATSHKEAAVDELTVTVQSLGIVDTPEVQSKSKKRCLSSTADKQSFV